MPIENKMATYALRVTPEEDKLIRAAAKRRGVYMSEFVRESIDRIAKGAVSDARQLSLVEAAPKRPNKRKKRLMVRMSDLLRTKAVSQGQDVIRASVMRKAAM